jgi:hypothetical protein
MNRASANQPRGTMTFNANQGGYDFASLLLGYPASAISPEALHPTLPVANRWGAYFLDDWKISSRLTVNLGLRWDYFGIPIDQGGGWRTLSFNDFYNAPNGTKIPIIIPVPTDSRGAIKLWEQEKRFFMPRVGFAYRPGNKWVIRSGAGWFADVEHLNTFTILANMPPFGGSQQFDAVTDPARTVPVTANGTDYNIATRRFRCGSPIVSFDNPFGGNARVSPSNLLYIQPNHRSPNQWQWSLDIQRELPLSTALTVGYVGSKSTNVGNTVANFNSPDPSPDTNFQRRRPFQQFYDDGRIQDLGGLRLIDSFGNGSSTACKCRSKSATRTVWCTDSRTPSARQWETGKPAVMRTAISKISGTGLPRGAVSSSTRPRTRFSTSSTTCRSARVCTAQRDTSSRDGR